jgi:NAD(P)-dependent dehydrogenase (short-subunit alcohol dehydrogenase family)
MGDLIMNKKVALVTGASSGIGMATALELYAKGFSVYGAARRIDKMQNLAAKGMNITALDVTDEASIVSCVDAILDKEGRIDVLVNNAGYGSFGPIEAVPMEEARRQLEVNLFGLARLIQLVLPAMRQNQYGKIVNISSMGGKVATPFGGWYHTAKFAVEGFSDCLRMEVAPFGIDVIVIEPGVIKTDWGIIAAEHLKQSSGKSAYAAPANRTAQALMRNYTGNLGTRPEIIAKTIGKAVTASKPKTRYLLGYGAKLSVFLKRISSDRAFDHVIQKIMG